VTSASGEDTATGSRRKHILRLAVFAAFLLALAGIPLSSGFIAKFAVFKAAIEGGAVPLVVVGVVASVVAVYFYARVIVLMFFTEGPDDAAGVAPSSPLSVTVIAIAAIGTVMLGLAPGPMLDLADTAARFLTG
jgi:NADH-quinone oxidoreductase subunit N